MNSDLKAAEWSGEPREFGEEHTEVAFPLGGIGTGNVSLGARGNLTDWELFNRPGKGNELPYSFFMLRCETAGEDAVSRVLEGPIAPPHSHSSGYPPTSTAGLRRMSGSTFVGEYPVATVSFEDEDVPAEVSLEAYTPFVPLNPDDSGIPVAILEYTVRNVSESPMDASIVGTLPNPIGCAGETGITHHLKADHLGGNRNETREGDGWTAVQYRSEAYEPTQFRYGDVSLAVPETEGVSQKTTWDRDAWWDAYRGFCTEFRESGRLTDNTFERPSEDRKTDVGSIALSKTIEPGDSETFAFFVCWHFPNRPNSWNQSVPDSDPGESDDDGGSCCGDENCCEPDGPADGEDTDDETTARNRYAARFDSSIAVADYVTAEYDRLRERTYAFRDAFFDSTLPGCVLEAVSSQIAVIRSTTCVWFEDGTFLGYEGCHPDSGCCPGSCTHVWNYAQTLARHFPSLEREMRRIDFEESAGDDGAMDFRTAVPFDDEFPWNQKPAVDGQMGTIMRLYREWLYSGDDAFLERLWPHAKRALEFAFEYEEWDSDRKGVIEGEQHNTYDIEFYGPNSMLQSWYLGALRAGAEMARAVGDAEAADTYERVFERGRKRTDELLWNGEYYVQHVNDPDEHRYQYGTGCLSDQLLGQWYAELLGLESIFPTERVERALDAIYEYNFRSDLSEHTNHQRVYALNDEGGLLLCTWPHGGEPAYPFVYSDEVWTGIEYHVASHLIMHGRVDEGLELVAAVRDRHDGIKRNPWNEFECGNHYARAMSSWAVYDALCGLRVDLREGNEETNAHGFTVDPVRDDEPFRCFWITGDEWGVYERTASSEETSVLYGRP